MSRRQRDAEKQRADMAAYRAQCAAALETFDAPIKPEVAAKVAAFNQHADEAAALADRGGDQYVALDLISIEEDLETGCMIWTGYFSDVHGGEYPKQNGQHEICKGSHFTVARAMMEELLGRILDRYTEKVYATCATNRGYRKPCVNPLHHEIREESN